MTDDYISRRPYFQTVSFQFGCPDWVSGANRMRRPSFQYCSPKCRDTPKGVGHDYCLDVRGDPYVSILSSRPSSMGSQETTSGFLSATQTAHVIPSMNRCEEFRPEDLIFSFVDTRIIAIGVARSYRCESPKPAGLGSVSRGI